MNRLRALTVPLVAMLWMLGAGPVAGLELNGFNLDGALVPATAIQRGGPPRDGIPSIDAPSFVDAARSRLRDDDRVLGLVIDGQARAYPIRILNWHEVVNDRFGERDVVVSYCPLCGTGMAFDGAVSAQRTSFGVSGLLYNSDVLLYDRRTESLWSQIMLTAVAGPLKGQRLKQIATSHTSWSDWRQRQPQTRVLSFDTGFARDYARDPYAGYDRIPRLMFEVQHRDDRFPLKEWVLGLTLDGKTKAYPFSRLARAVGADGELRDVFAGQPVRIRFDAAHGTAEAFGADGEPLPTVMAFWFAWVAFHPQTEVLHAR